jgi:hypothetical protein
MEVAVKYERVSNLGSKAAIFPAKTEAKKLTRRERIERWATLLEQHHGRLMPFMRTEYLSHEARNALRADNSPLALAFADPLLREDGLAGDTMGEGMIYFGLSQQKAHRLLCDCHYSGTMTGERVASRLRAAAKPGLVERVREWASARG